VLHDELFGTLNDKQKEYLGDILASGKHLLSLINDILDLSKIEAGKLELELSIFSLKEAFKAAMSMFKEKAMKHEIRLDLEMGPDAEIEIEADERKLKQIMFNLLSNAVKFTPDGGSVQITARKTGSGEGEKGLPETAALPRVCTGRDFIEISVTDTGLGIKPEDIPKLFKEFTQLEAACTKNREGTGLGLALTKKLVELHKGRIWIESEIGKGSTLLFVIPVSQRNPEDGKPEENHIMTAERSGHP